MGESTFYVRLGRYVHDSGVKIPHKTVLRWVSIDVDTAESVSADGG